MRHLREIADNNLNHFQIFEPSKMFSKIFFFKKQGKFLSQSEQSQTEVPIFPRGTDHCRYSKGDRSVQ